MEPSLSLEPTIVLRSSQGESRFGSRVVIDPGSGALRPDHTEALSEVAAAPLAVLRAVAGRWLLDAAREGRVSINGVAVGGARIVSAGDVISVAESQLLVEESAATLVLRRFDLIGNETLPPVGDSLRALPLPPTEVAVEMGEVPRIDGPLAVRARPDTARSRWNFAAWALALVLLSVLGLFGLLQPIALDLKPGDAAVSAQNSFSWQSASSLFVFPGQHQLRASREGYQPTQVPVSVQRGAQARALIHLVKLPGKLQVDTGGINAEVFADGARVGRVPAVVEVPAGDRTLTFKAPKYLEHIERITIQGGGEKQQLKVVLKPSFAVVSVSSVPAGAQIEVDGKPAGVTPAKLEMDSGIRRVQIAAPGLRVWSSSVVVAPGIAQTIGPIELGAADARITVHSVPAGAQVTTGGSFRGNTPVTVDLSPGVAHSISITRAGYAPWTREVFAEAGKESRLDARLAALLVEVRLQGEPADAEVFVNGESRGKAPVSMSLPASRQRVEVRKEGYNTFATDLVLAPGIARTVDFKLVNPKDVAANSPARLTTKSAIKLLLVAGGTFQAGSERREQGRRPNEGGHKVTLLRPFYMGEREITNAQFRQFRASHNSGLVGSYSLDLDKQPVARVTWDDAAEFCNWLSTEEGLTPAYSKTDAGNFTLITPVGNGYRLPTEAEWEFVARAAGTGKLLKYPWGSDLPVVSGTANIAGAEAAGLLGASVAGHRDEFVAVAAPALFAPNALGFYDLAGNVSEWTNDRYLSFVASAAVTDPLGPTDGKSHTYRGSSWRTVTTAELRFPWREGATDASDSIGFRVARYVAPQ